MSSSKQRLWVSIFAAALLLTVARLTIAQAVQADDASAFPAQAQAGISHVDAAAAHITLTKEASDSYPTPGQRITYTLTAVNTSADTAMTGALISDTLPAGLSFAGPITLDPPAAGGAGSAPPLLVYNLTISPGQSVDVTFPVTVAEGLPATAVITNTATITSSQVPTPTTATHSLVLAGVIYVDADAMGSPDGSSWANAFTTVQDALATAGINDEIWVAEGVYYPDEGAGQTDNARASTFALRNEVALYGGFVGTETLRTQRDWSAHVTILSGDIDGNDTNTDGNNVAETWNDVQGANAYHVVTGSGINASAVLDGFTVTAGYANGTDPHDRGGGLTSVSGSPQLANLTFCGNYGVYGGGISLQSSSPGLINVTLSGNYAYYIGGGMYGYQSQPALDNVTFDSNTAYSYGGGMANLEGSNATLYNVTFRSNQAVRESGGGMYNYNSSPQVTNALFVGNSTRRHGGGVSNGPFSSGTFINVAFYGNYASGGTDSAGGGMFNYNGSTLQIINATFAGNYAAFHGGGLTNYNGGNNATLTNSILWGNAAGVAGDQVYLDTGDDATLNTSLVEGGCPAGATCNAPFLINDPQFVAPIAASSAPTTTGNYRLAGGSPAIDAGNSGAVAGVSTDLDGEKRVTGEAVDLGAYEYAGLALTKQASTAYPAAGQRITYTLMAINSSSRDNVSGALISDTLPPGLIFAGPVTLDPPEAGSVGSAPPLLAHNLNISAEKSVTITFPVTVAEGLPATTVITNTASITSSEVLTPILTVHPLFVAGAIYVDADAVGASTGFSWTNAFTNVQDGLAVAANGDEIWVAEGVYYPDEGAGQTNNDRTSSFALKRGVALYGGFMGVESERDARNPYTHLTILSGDIDHETNPDTNTDGNGIAETWADIQGANAYHVVLDPGTDATAILDGFVVTAGLADGSGDPHYKGGGMLVESGSSQVANVAFSGNQARYGGGLYNETGSPTLVIVRFRGNQADQDGGGMYNWWDGNPTLTNVEFSGNQAGQDGGGMCNYDVPASLTNVTFFGNYAGQNGGGMTNREDSYPSLVNVTFGGNRAGGSGGGIYNSQTLFGNQPTLVNCILWGNTSPQMVNEQSGPTLSYSLVEGGCPGGATCNSPLLGDNPRFLASLPASSAPTTAGDYRLTGGSLAINAGDGAALPGDVTTDLDGNPRVLGTRVDLGAYEYIGLALNKRASTPYPAAGQRITFTLTAINAFTATEMSGALISDTLPAGLSLARPITLDPPGAGTVGSEPPLLVYDLVISAGQNVTVTLPVTVETGLAATAIITNTATITSSQVPTSVVAQRPLFLAGTLYVDADAAGTGDGFSWSNAYTTLQDALAVATSGDEIWVAEGVYYPDEGAGHTNDDRTSSFGLVQGAAVYGGFEGTETRRSQRDWDAHVTILSGDIDCETSPDTDTNGNGIAETWTDVQGNNAYHVVLDPGTDAGAVLDGFAITAGRADGSDPHDDGGGLLVSGGSPQLANLTFSGNQAANGGGGMYIGDDSDATLTNVAFRGNQANYGGGLRNDQSVATLTSVEFRGNQANQSGGGMYTYVWEYIDLINILFSGNRAAQNGGGMYIRGLAQLYHVTLSGNLANEGGGVYNYNSSLRFYDCVLWGNAAASSGPQMASIYGYSSLYHSLVQGGCPSDAMCQSPFCTADPQFLAPVTATVAPTITGDYHLAAGSPAIDAGDNSDLPAGISTDLDGRQRIVGGTVDLGPYEWRLTVRYVDASATGANNGTSWYDAYTNLQDALDIATCGDEIWVAKGVYTPTNAAGPTATFALTNCTALYGGFSGYNGLSETLRSQRDWTAQVTVLSGDLDGNDTKNEDGVITDTANITGTNAYHVVTGNGVIADTVLDGFTITGGNANGSDPHHQGGGMYNAGGSPTLANIVFSGNRAENSGGGICNDNSAPRLTNAAFHNNSTVGYGGGMLNNSSAPTLTNVLFSGNSATLSGGGMFNELGSNPTLVNLTFSGNYAAEYGGGIYNSDSAPTMTNSILWGNTAVISGPQMYNSSSAPILEYSLVEGGCPSGATCNTPLLTDDPRFVAPVSASPAPTITGNYRLQPTSPAIDAGDNTAVPSGVTTDLDGNPRVVGPKVDMGVYEAPHSSGIQGTVTSYGHCDVNPAPLEGADVLLESSTGISWTLKTNASGSYTQGIHQVHSPLTVTVTHPEHETGIATGVLITSLMTTTVNFDLHWLVPCVSVESDRLAITLGMGMSTTLSVSITNSGLVSTPFALVEGAPWLFEDPVTGTVPASGTQAIDVTLDAAYVALPGVHTATLTVKTDDPVSPSYGIPVTMTVTCTEVTDINLFYTNTGTIYTDTLVHFVADVAPDDVAKPYNYTIDYDDGTALVTDSSGADPLAFSHTFATTGTFDVEIAIWNCGMIKPVTGTMRVVVTEYGVCVDLSSITIAGPTSGYPGVYSFTTSYEPIYASLPISHTWDDGGTGTVSVRTLDAGTHTVAVTATNCFALGTSALVTDTHQIRITAYHIHLPSVLRND